mgnify:CR=1 FL=1
MNLHINGRTGLGWRVDDLDSEKVGMDFVASPVPDRKLAEAIAAEARGDKEEAEAIVSEPIEDVVVRVEPAIEKVEGSFDRSSWSAECFDLEATILWAAQDVKARSCYLAHAQVGLNAHARAKKSVDLGIPGVRGVKTTTLNTRKM